VQSQIRVGQISVTRQDPNYFVARVLSNILGGGFNSRLNKAIRVDKGLTYGARGGIEARRFEGHFLVRTFTKTATTADTIRTILAEIERLRTSPPDSQELADTQTYLVGSFAGERETPQAVVNDLWTIAMEKLPSDFYSQYLAAVRKTTPQEVLSAARELIKPDSLVIVVVGEARLIRTDLEKIAPVTIVNQPATTPEEQAAKEDVPAPDDED